MHFYYFGYKGKIGYSAVNTNTNNNISNNNNNNNDFYSAKIRY